MSNNDIFSIDNETWAEINAWIHEQRENEKARRKSTAYRFKKGYSVVDENSEDDYEYKGATGGEITYSFTPTSLGVCISVKYYAFDGPKEKNFTDYNSW